MEEDAAWQEFDNDGGAAWCQKVRADNGLPARTRRATNSSPAVPGVHVCAPASNALAVATRCRRHDRDADISHCTEGPRVSIRERRTDTTRSKPCHAVTLFVAPAMIVHYIEQS